MLDPFDQKKSVIMKEILTTNESNKDASPKGTIDEKCLPIINLINNNPDMVTTSSCSGRVSVFIEGIKATEKIGSKGNQGRWCYVNHDVNIEEWFMTIPHKFDLNGQYPTNKFTRYILYKFEPLILHVKCRNTQVANELYKTAMNCGFRESGIGSNNLVAIRISIKLDVPIGYLVNEEVYFNVNEEYLRFITRLSIDRFEENFKKMDQLYEAIEIFEITQVEVETKEQRRQRKIQQGLARQAIKNNIQ